MSKEDVDHLLRQYKLEHHYDEREHKLYASLGAFARTGTSSACLQDEIVLGRDGKVATVRETIVFTAGWGFAGSREIQRCVRGEPRFSTTEVHGAALDGNHRTKSRQD